MPAVREAAAAGHITPGHVEVMAKVVAGADASVRRAMTSPDGQAELVGIAKRVDATQFTKSAAAWIAAHDAAAHERGHQAQRAARFLHVTDTADGTYLKGRLDAMAGHRLRLALEAVSPRPSADDVRSSEQRRADALVDLGEAVLADPGTTTGASVRPHVSFHLTAETWAALRAQRGRERLEDGAAHASGDEPDGTGHGVATEPDGTGHGVVAEPMPVVPVTLDDGSTVPSSEVARALCDCELTRIVTGADGELLDVGRAARTYTGAQRRAVIARDRHCGWPGCAQPARWCEVHHIRWWDRDDGATSVENGVLLCSFHHHEVHRRDYTLTRHPGAPPGSGSPAGRSLSDPSLANRSPEDRLVADASDVALVHYTVHSGDGRQVAPVTIRGSGAVGRGGG